MVLLYYITDRRQFPGSEAERRYKLLDKVSEAARCGVDFIQLREKDLPSRELEELARQAVSAVRASRPATGRPPVITRILINSRLDVALSSGADGVHLTSTDISASDARAIWARASHAGNRKPENGNCVIGVSCHTAEEVARAESHGADFAVFAPVFEKEGRPGIGLDEFRKLRRQGKKDPKVEAGGDSARIPVLALGGVTLDNARACVEAGAAGIAAIRLFQEKEISAVVAHLREQR